MASLTLVRDAQAALDDLTTLVAADTLALWRASVADNPETVTRNLLGEARSITDLYGGISAQLAADMYAESRAAAGVRGRFVADTAETAAASRVEAAVRWSVTPLFRPEPDQALALANLSGSLDRLSRQPNRTTIMRNTGRDSAAEGVVRVAQSGGCAFCLMLASRGTEHVTKHGASSADRWHRNCRCQPTPAYGAGYDDMPDPADLYADYHAATAGSDNPAKAWRQHVAASRA